MTIYLTIITTILVLTQIIRITQNHIQLKRQKIQFEKNLGDLAQCEPTKEDFDIQRENNRFLNDLLWCIEPEAFMRACDKWFPKAEGEAAEESDEEADIQV